MPQQPMQPTGRRRFWFTVTAFAVLNACVWFGFLASRHPAPSSVAALKVERFAPGEGAIVSPRQPISWTLSADVGPAAPGPIAEPPGTILPAVPGKWAWSDSRTLTFTPDADLPRASRFTLTLLPQKLSAVGRLSLEQPFVATVQTRPLELLGVRHVGVVDGQPILELAFNDTVLPPDVRSHVTVHDAGDKIPVELHGETKGKLVRLRCSPRPMDGREGAVDLRVTLSPGLAGASGPLGLATEASSLVRISSDLVATEAYAYCPPGGDPAITVRFNGPVEIDTIRSILNIEPAVPFTLARQYENSLRMTGAFVPGTRYTVRLAKAPAGPEKAFPRAGTLSVFMPDRPSAVWLDHEQGYLGAQGNRTLMAHAVNVPAVRVTVTRIYDNNLIAWRNAGPHRYGVDPTAYGRPVASRKLELTGARNVQQDLRLSLDDLLPPEYRRDGVYRINLATDVPESPDRVEEDDDREGYNYRRRSDASAMVTLSDIGLSARKGRDGVQVWAVSLASAKPIEQVRVRLYSDKGQLLQQAMTGADGLAALTKLQPAPGEAPAVVIADLPAAHDGEPVIASTVASGSTAPENLPAGLTWLDLRTSETTVAEADVGGKPYLRTGYEAFIYTDRGVYRPGETIHFRTIVRGGGQAIPASFPLKWQFRRPDLRDWKSEITPLDADGAAGLDLQLPSDLPTGRWSASVCLPGDKKSGSPALGTITFQVEEFMPERIKVTAKFTAGGKTPGRLALSNKKIEAAVQGDYLFGRPASGLPATLATRIEPILFEAKDWRGWTFGDSADVSEPLGRSKPLGLRNELEAKPLDTNGHAVWRLDAATLLRQGTAVDGKNRGDATDASAGSTFNGPWRLTVAGSVTEQGGRAVTTSQTIDVDGLPFYIAARPEDASPRAGMAAAVEVALVKPTGELLTDGAALIGTLYRESWNTTLLHSRGGQYRYQSTRKLEPVGKPIAIAVVAGNARAEVMAPAGGRYVLVINDPATKAETTFGFYATENAWQDNISRENPEKIDLVLLPPIASRPVSSILTSAMSADLPGLVGGLRAMSDAATATDAGPTPVRYHVGEQARVLIRSPFAGRLMLCVETDGIVSRRVIDMPASQMVLPIEVTDACRPNAYVTATVIRAIDPNASWRAHRAAGVARLALAPDDRKLTIQFAGPKEIRPETTLSAEVRITDDRGQPAGGAAVTVAAVDEGILQLTNFKTPDPLAFFLAPRALGVRVSDIYSLLMPEVAKPQADRSVGGDGEGAAGGRHSNPVAAKRVNSVALFTGVLHANDEGVARVELPVGQFAGRLRLMAVAYTGSGSPKFGNAESQTVVRSPLLVQSSWPRFAAPGDRFLVPFSIFNNGTTDGVVKLRLVLDAAAGDPPLKFAANGQASIDLPPMSVAAGHDAVTSVEVLAGNQAGACRVRLSGQMGNEVFNETLELPVRPAAPWMTEGGFVAASPDAAGKISPPADTLTGTRQLQLRVTPWPTLGLPRGLDYLDRYPYGCAEQTTSTAFPLVYLNDIGERIAPGRFDRNRLNDKIQLGILRLMGMQTADGGLAMWPGGRETWPWASVYGAHFLLEAQSAGFAVPEAFRDSLLGYCRSLLDRGSDSDEMIEVQSYACYVLSTAGKPPRAAMSRLAELVNRPGEDEATQAFRGSTARWHLAMAWLAAGRRDLPGGLVPNILPKPRQGRQLSGNLASPIRDRAILLTALLAVDPARPEVAALAKEIADAGEKGRWNSTQETAMAVVALGRYLKVAASGPAYESAELWSAGGLLASSRGASPLLWDLKAGEALPQGLEVRVAGQPKSQAFVSWIQTGVPTRPPTLADDGMIVRRRFLDRDGKELLPARVVTGELLQVELTLKCATPLQNVVIEDLLPAGLEIENTRLESGAAVASVRGKRSPPATGRNLFTTVHLDPRDDRMVVMGHLEAGGKGTFTYLTRAVAPGMFVIPPVRGECMYDGGISSISGGGTLTVLSAAQAKVVWVEE